MEGINFIEIFIYIINFLVTFALLYWLLYKPVSKFLSARKERIISSLKQAEDMQTQAQAIFGEAQAELDGTAEKARQITHNAIENAARDAEQILDDAEEKAAQMVQSAREQMRAERRAALERAFTELVSMAKEVSSRILSREVNIEDNRKIAEDFFSEAKKKYGYDKTENKTEPAAAQQEEKNA